MSNFVCQSQSVDTLKSLAEKDKHSLVIQGYEGCGKTYLARKYASYVGFRDVVVVQPKVSDIKSAFESFLKVENKVLIVIENLDLGVPACAYVLLKFMEEPSENLYVAVTCRSVSGIPDTIVSRSMVVSVAPPTAFDLAKYAHGTYPEAYDSIKSTLLWKCVKSFVDVDEVCSMDANKLSYFSQWDTMKPFSDSVSNIAWKLGHYDDGSEASSIVVKYVMEANKSTPHVVNCCRRCLDTLNLRRIAKYLTLTKLAFDLKYCE